MDFISYIAVPTDCVTAIDSSLDTIRIVANTHIQPRLFQRAVDDGLIYLFFVYLLQDRPLTAEPLVFRTTARLLIWWRGTYISMPQGHAFKRYIMHIPLVSPYIWWRWQESHLRMVT